MQKVNFSYKSLNIIFTLQINSIIIDIGLLTSGAISAIIPMLKNGIGTFTGEASKSLFQWITNKLSANNKQKDLEALKINPEDQRLQGRVESTLEYKQFPRY